MIKLFDRPGIAQVYHTEDYPAKRSDFATFSLEEDGYYHLAELLKKGYKIIIVIHCVDGYQVMVKIPEERDEIH